MKIIMKSEHGRIRLTVRKVMCEHKTTKKVKPSTWSLFQAIDSLLKATHMSRKMRINKGRSLRHEDFFSKETMKKCILNIKLTIGPMIGNSNEQDKINGGRANKRSKTVMKVDTFLLMIASSDQSCFVTIQ